jgi:hypothetical protein
MECHRRHRNGYCLLDEIVTQMRYVLKHEKHRIPRTLLTIRENKIKSQKPNLSCQLGMVRARVMVFNATFNKMSAISWRLVLLVEELEENHRPAASH